MSVQDMENNRTADSISLVKTSGQDLLKVFEWLKSHLPLSWKLSCMLRETLEGRWKGQTWWVLQRQDSILAVGEGIPDENSEIINYLTKPRCTCYFSPNHVHAEMLLTWPGFIDWSEPCIFEMLSNDNAAVVGAVSKTNNGTDSFPRTIRCIAIVANPGDVKLRPVPRDLTMRDLDPLTDTDLVISTWKYSRAHADEFVRALITHFPSVGLFDQNNRCLGFELTLQDEKTGLLYVYRKVEVVDWAKVIISNLGHKNFALGLPAAALVCLWPMPPSLKMHLDLGSRLLCELPYVLHIPGDKFSGETVLRFTFLKSPIRALCTF
ncbi:unnamed protein product [Candidula unifasciata]|uniref:Uncharacterized protein n=1 Tax=Candidula unifasciata TaxID=100452 RepID=A0A8S3YXS3_9EUPU|nr:unnamed protein product [Candidula unifasciata]